jgi:hypothetical protein
LYSIIDLGTQENKYDPSKGPKRIIRLTWELPKKRAEFDGQSKPLVLSKELSFSMFNQATLRKIVEAMIGEALSDKAADDFDFNKIIGAGCLISVKHTKSNDGTKTYNSYAGCAPLMEGMTVPKLCLHPCLTGSSKRFKPHQSGQVKGQRKKKATRSRSNERTSKGCKG